MGASYKYNEREHGRYVLPSGKIKTHEAHENNGALDYFQCAIFI